jgi:hypothetical protein
MENYDHKITGIYTSPEAAGEARARLVERGFPAGRIELLDAQHLPPHSDQEVTSRDTDHSSDGAKSDEVLKDVLIDGGIGAAVGTGIGALAQVALVAANVSLFVASPLIAPLAMLGWGASLGGLVGAAAGAESRQGQLSDLVGDAIASGSVVLVAHASDANETRLAQEVMRDSLMENRAAG